MGRAGAEGAETSPRSRMDERNWEAALGAGEGEDCIGAAEAGPAGAPMEGETTGAPMEGETTGARRLLKAPGACRCLLPAVAWRGEGGGAQRGGCPRGTGSGTAAAPCPPAPPLLPGFRGGLKEGWLQQHLGPGHRVGCEGWSNRLRWGRGGQGHALRPCRRPRRHSKRLPWPRTSLDCRLGRQTPSHGLRLLQGLTCQVLRPSAC